MKKPDMKLKTLVRTFVEANQDDRFVGAGLTADGLERMADNLIEMVLMAREGAVFARECIASEDYPEALEILELMDRGTAGRLASIISDAVELITEEDVAAEQSSKLGEALQRGFVSGDIGSC